MQSRHESTSLINIEVSARCKRFSRRAELFPPFVALFLLAFCAAPVAHSETFRVATYNVENYLDEPTETRPSKSAESKAKVCENIAALRPDVLALQEMGSLKAFAQ